MLDPLRWLTDEIAAWEARGLRRRAVERAGPQRGCTFVHQGREYLNFGSNDYLGLAADPAIVKVVREHLDATGWGAGASPLVTGRGAWHARLEQRLAQFEGTEAALLFPTGYAANVGTIGALVGAGDAVFSDAKNHASIIDGCRLSGAAVSVYHHRDTSHLRQLLIASTARRRLIVTDTLFSMDGDLAPLSELLALASDHDAMLLVDEAHATGVLGHDGKGLTSGITSPCLIRVGTLSKALGSHGGFVAGSQLLIDWLANRARPYVFSTASPEACAIATYTALDISEQQPERRATVLAHADRLRSAARERGWNSGDSQSQIVPIFLGDPQRTMQASLALRDLGLWVPGIRPPSVPAGESLLRISLTAVHTPEMIDQLIEGLNKVLGASDIRG
jgi:8-amino-7-oxononanoate synthase